MDCLLHIRSVEINGFNLRLLKRAALYLIVNNQRKDFKRVQVSQETKDVPENGIGVEDMVDIEGRVDCECCVEDHGPDDTPFICEC